MSTALATRLRLFRTISEPHHIPDSEVRKEPPAERAGIGHRAVEEGTIIRLMSRRVNFICGLESLSCAVGLTSILNDSVSLTSPLPHKGLWLMQS